MKRIHKTGFHKRQENLNQEKEKSRYTEKQIRVLMIRETDENSSKCNV